MREKVGGTYKALGHLESEKSHFLKYQIKAKSDHTITKSDSSLNIY